MRHYEGGRSMTPAQIWVGRPLNIETQDIVTLNLNSAANNCDTATYYASNTHITSTKGTMDPEGTRLLTYSTIMLTVSPTCRLCINIHHYALPRIVLQPAAGRCGRRSATRKALVV